MTGENKPMTDEEVRSLGQAKFLERMGVKKPEEETPNSSTDEGRNEPSAPEASPETQQAAKSGDEDQQENKIPMDRFNEVISQKNQFKQKYEELANDPRVKAALEGKSDNDQQADDDDDDEVANYVKRAVKDVFSSELGVIREFAEEEKQKRAQAQVTQRANAAIDQLKSEHEDFQGWDDPRLNRITELLNNGEVGGPSALEVAYKVATAELGVPKPKANEEQGGKDEVTDLKGASTAANKPASRPIDKLAGAKNQVEREAAARNFFRNLLENADEDTKTILEL